jgi:UDP-glucuronate 4-epimerase
MRILVTGIAGFIGAHVAQGLAARGHEVLGFDSFNAYYDPRLKHARVAALLGETSIRTVRVDLADEHALAAAMGDFRPDVIVHLAAQAGVRYSLENPLAYIDSNVRAHVNLLELARRAPGLVQFIYASSSSVYGERTDVPFRETDRCDAPASVYAATKRSCELLSETYARLFSLSCVGLRFFTVYGPWGRPDMAYWLFADAILRSEPIRLFNGGRMRRDFTHISDIVASLLLLVEGSPLPGHELYNVGHAEPVELGRFVRAIEAALGIQARTEPAAMQPGDVTETFADSTKLRERTGYHPKVGVEDGIADFVDWFRRYRAIATHT